MRTVRNPAPDNQSVVSGVRSRELEITLAVRVNGACNSSSGSSRSISAPGTIAPVESATTPCSDGDGGGADEEAFAARANVGARKRKEKAKRRIMQNLQGRLDGRHAGQAERSSLQQMWNRFHYPPNAVAIAIAFVKKIMSRALLGVPAKNCSVMRPGSDGGRQAWQGAHSENWAEVAHLGLSARFQRRSAGPDRRKAIL